MSLSAHCGIVVIAAAASAAAFSGPIVSSHTEFITHTHTHTVHSSSHERQAAKSHLSFSRHLNLADPIACMSWKQSDAVELVQSNEEATELYQAEEKLRQNRIHARVTKGNEDLGRCGYCA